MSLQILFIVVILQSYFQWRLPVLLLYHFPFLHSFLCLNPSCWIDPPTSMITAFRNSTNEILLVVNSFNFTFPRYVLILSSSLKNSFAGCPIPGSEFSFSFSLLGFYLLPSVLHTADERSAIVLICVSGS